MHLKSIVLIVFVVLCEAFAGSEVESKGKKKKIALFVFIADIILKKVFILKLIYAFIFWVIIHKAGYFLTWFISYLKEQHHHPHHDHDYNYGPHYEHSYGPYRRKSHGIH